MHASDTWWNYATIRGTQSWRWMLGLLNIFISWHLRGWKFHNRLVLFAQAEPWILCYLLSSQEEEEKHCSKNLMCSTVEQIHTCYSEASSCAYVYSDKFIWNVCHNSNQPGCTNVKKKPNKTTIRSGCFSFTVLVLCTLAHSQGFTGTSEQNRTEQNRTEPLTLMLSETPALFLLSLVKMSAVEKDVFSLNKTQQGDCSSLKTPIETVHLRQTETWTLPPLSVYKRKDLDKRSDLMCCWWQSRYSSSSSSSRDCRNVHSRHLTSAAKLSVYHLRNDKAWLFLCPTHLQHAEHFADWK